jgi:hypothetical protein
MTEWRAEWISPATRHLNRCLSIGYLALAPVLAPTLSLTFAMPLSGPPSL